LTIEKDKKINCQQFSANRGKILRYPVTAPARETKDL
jgi:hypothetical protein